MKKNVKSGLRTNRIIVNLSDNEFKVVKSAAGRAKLAVFLRDTICEHLEACDKAFTCEACGRFLGYSKLGESTHDGCDLCKDCAERG